MPARREEEAGHIRDCLPWLIRQLLDAHGADEPDDAEYLSGGWEFWGDFGAIADRHARPSRWLASVEADRAVTGLHAAALGRQA